MQFFKMLKNNFQQIKGYSILFGKKLGKSFIPRQKQVNQFLPLFSVHKNRETRSPNKFASRRKIICSEANLEASTEQFANRGDMDFIITNF